MLLVLGSEWGAWVCASLLQVEVTKRHAFLTMTVGVVYQHLAFFRQGSTLLGRIEGPYSDAMAIVEHLRKEGQARQVGAGAVAGWAAAGVRGTNGGWEEEAAQPCWPCVRIAGVRWSVSNVQLSRQGHALQGAFWHMCVLRPWAWVLHFLVGHGCCALPVHQMMQ